MKKAIKILALIMAILLLGLALFSCSEEKESDKDDDNSSKKTVPLSDPDEAAKALRSNGYTVELDSEDERVFIRAYNGERFSTSDDFIEIAYNEDKSSAIDSYDNAKEYFESCKEEDEDRYEDASVGRDGTVVWVGTKDAIKAASKINKNTSSNDNSFNDNEFSSAKDDSTESAIKETTLDTESSTSSAFISDPDKVVNAFKAKGYLVEKISDNLPDEVTLYILAGSTTNDHTIHFLYCESKTAANNMYEDMLEEIQEEDMAGSGWVLSREGNVVWFGYPDILKDVFGIDPEDNDYYDTEISTSDNYYDETYVASSSDYYYDETYVASSSDYYYDETYIASSSTEPPETDVASSSDYYYDETEVASSSDYYYCETDVATERIY